MAKSSKRKTQTVSKARPASGRLRPRTRDYDYSRDAGGGASKGPPDDMTLKPGAPVSVYRLKYSAGPTIARLVPMLKAENPAEEWDPWRLDNDNYGFSDFIRKYKVAKFFGTESPRTFILYDPVAAAAHDYDIKSNPYQVLYNSLKNAADDSNLPNQAWGRLIRKSPRSSSFPYSAAFVHVLCAGAAIRACW